MALRPAEHIISLAETCPTAEASGLPCVEGVEIFPCCWSPHQGASTSYTYRTPLLDTGVPTIGVAGILPNGGTNALLEALSHLLPQLPAVRLILPATVSAGLSSEDVERIAALGSEASSLDLVDALPYDEIDVLLGIHVDLVDVCGAADHGVPLLTALPFVSHYAAHLLEQLGLSAAGTVQETAAQICAGGSLISPTQGTLCSPWSVPMSVLLWAIHQSPLRQLRSSSHRLPRVSIGARLSLRHIGWTGGRSCCRSSA